MDWSKLKAEYISGGTSYRRLAEKYNISFSKLKRVAIKEKWADLREQARTEADTKMIAVVSKKQVDKMKRIQDITDKLLDKLERAVDELDIHIAKKTVKTKDIEYNNRERPDKPTKETINETEEIVDYASIVDRKGVQELSAALKNIKEVQMLKSEADLREQEARIAKLQKEAMKEDDGSTEVVVSFGTEEEHNTWAE